MSFFTKRKAAKEQTRREAEAAEEKAQKADGLRAFVNGLIQPDGSISAEAGSLVEDYMKEHGIPAADSPPDVGRTIALGFANAGKFFECSTTLLLKQSEVAYLDAPASLLKEVTKREFRGGSQGLSVPLGGGFRYRIGAMRGHLVTIGTEWQTADTGTLTITNQRVVYHGGRKTLEFAFAKLVGLTVYSDAINLGVTNRQSTSSFRVPEPEFVAGMIRAAFGASNS